MTEKQTKYVRNILWREGVQDQEYALTVEFSNGRTGKLEDLTHAETQALIAAFNKRTPAQKMRGKILSMAHEMRWEQPNGKVDMERLNNWCNKHTPYHCDFNKFSEAELTVVVSIFEKLYKNYLKTV